MSGTGSSAGVAVDTAPKPLVLGVMLRACVRTKTLEIVWRELERYATFPGLRVKVCCMLDRPSVDVQRIAGRFQARRRADTLLIAAPRRMLDADGEHFIEGLNFQMDAMEAVWSHLDWIFAADDDRFFEAVKITDELPRALHDETRDVYFCKSLFMWDKPNVYNDNRHHDSALFFRHETGQRWSGRRMINVPDDLYDQAVLSGRVGHLNTPLLDYGTYDANERCRVYAAFAGAGKRDAYVQSIHTPADLRRFPEDFNSRYGEWRDLWSGAP